MNLSIPIKSCTDTFPLILLTFTWFLTWKLPECAHRENVTQQYGLSACEIKVSHNFCGVRYVVRSITKGPWHMSEQCVRGSFFPLHKGIEMRLVSSMPLSCPPSVCTFLPRDWQHWHRWTGDMIASADQQRRLLQTSQCLQHFSRLLLQNWTM